MDFLHPFSRTLWLPQYPSDAKQIDNYATDGGQEEA